MSRVAMMIPANPAPVLSQLKDLKASLVLSSHPRCKPAKKATIARRMIPQVSGKRA